MPSVTYTEVYWRQDKSGMWCKGCVAAAPEFVFDLDHSGVVPVEPCDNCGGAFTTITAAHCGEPRK